MRFTDLCDYCVWAKNSRTEIKKLLNDIPDFEYNEIFDPEGVISFLTVK